MQPIIGVDFDNTLVNYDDVLRTTAQRMKLITGASARKKHIRDAIRQLPNGEREWQRVQAHMYGKGMAEAVLNDGASEFLQMCRRLEVPIYIVSHKTEFASEGADQINLRQAALDWMTQKGFFDPNRFAFSTDQVFFEATRHEKIDRIKSLGCTHFIDDLEETFLEKSFPVRVKKILYVSAQNDSLPKEISVFSTWSMICDHLFGEKVVTK